MMRYKGRGDLLVGGTGWKGTRFRGIGTTLDDSSRWYRRRVDGCDVLVRHGFFVTYGGIRCMHMSAVLNPLSLLFLLRSLASLSNNPVLSFFSPS